MASIVISPHYRSEERRQGVCYFLITLDTIPVSCKFNCIFKFLLRNLMHLAYAKYIQRKCGNSYVEYMQKKCSSEKKKYNSQKKYHNSGTLYTVKFFLNTTLVKYQFPNIDFRFFKTSQIHTIFAPTL